MNILYTSDGLIGVKSKLSNKVIWCSSVEEAVPIARSTYKFLSQHDIPSLGKIDQEMRVAINEMIKYNHTKAEFGILGNFMYTIEEE